VIVAIIALPGLVVRSCKLPILMMPVKSLLVLLLCMAACTQTEKLQSQHTAFTGATIIDGTGAEPVPDGVVLIAGGRVVAVAATDAVDIPEGAAIKDVSGKTIIPGIINAHGHVGNAKGIEGGHYSRENVIDNLSAYARYGVTTVVSLGDDKKEGVPLRHVNDSTATGRARLFIAGEVITGKCRKKPLPW
jgi:hypothetical protein